MVEKVTVISTSRAKVLLYAHVLVIYQGFFPPLLARSAVN